MISASVTEACRVSRCTGTWMVTLAEPDIGEERRLEMAPASGGAIGVRPRRDQNLFRQATLQRFSISRGAPYLEFIPLDQDDRNCHMVDRGDDAGERGSRKIEHPPLSPTKRFPGAEHRIWLRLMPAEKASGEARTRL